MSPTSSRGSSTCSVGSGWSISHASTRSEGPPWHPLGDWLSWHSPSTSSWGSLSPAWYGWNDLTARNVWSYAMASSSSSKFFRLDDSQIEKSIFCSFSYTLGFGLAPMMWLAFRLMNSNLKPSGQNNTLLNVEQVDVIKYKSWSSRKAQIRWMSTTLGSLKSTEWEFNVDNYCCFWCYFSSSSS